MAIKTIVHSHCEYCKKRIAWKDDKCIRYVSCNCESLPPGPPDPPRHYLIGNVIFKEINPQDNEQ